MTMMVIVMMLLIIYLRRVDDFFIIFEQWMVEKDKELMDLEEVDEEAEMTMKKRRSRKRPEFP